MQGLIGQTIGRYRVIEHLGRGGMAEVYKAFQPSLDRYVAIKLMHAFLADDKDFLTRFEREAKVVATLRHPNIVQVYDFDFANGQYYMVMEYIDGVTLKTMLESMQERGEWVTLNDAIRIILSVGSALRYAHDRKMVHRDVKPANVMITSEGHVILTDFGIAKIMSTTGLTASGAMVGTPSYMSPEQGMGQPGDERSDIYALGVMLYQLVVGRLPYDADTPLAVVLKHINDPLPIPRALRSDLPEAVERVILKALAKNPDDRYEKVGEMMADLKRAIGMAPDDTPTEMMQRGTSIKLSSATVVGKIGATTPPVGAISSTTAGSGSGAGATVAREPAGTVAARPMAGAADAPAAHVAGRPAWLVPAIAVGAMIILGGGALLLSSAGAPAPTPTATMTPTPTIALTPTPSSYEPVEGSFKTEGNVVLYAGPDASTQAQGQVGSNRSFRVLTRSADSEWLQIEFPGGVVGWVPAELVDIGGVDINTIPEAVTLATLTPTQSPTVPPTDAPTPTETPPPTNTPAPTRPPATRPPVTATQPPQPTATATRAAQDPLGWGFQYDFCTYDGDNYTCNVTIWGTGGDGRYHFAVEHPDTGIWEEKTGGRATYLIRSRRCRIRIQQVRIWDESGNHIEPNLTTDPAVLGYLFPGGSCTES